MRKLFLVVPLLVLISFAVAQQSARKEAPARKEAHAAAPHVDADRIRAHVKFLSSDLLEGRGTGQRGGDVAAAYIASQFELYGLEPAGDDGTFMQKVPLVGITTLPDSKLTLQSGGQALGELKFRDDYVIMDETLAESSQAASDLVFVGYGIVAPEYNWNDYAGADVKGKMVVVLVNEPPSTKEDFFKGKALTYYGRWTYKYEEAARQGAAGALIVHQTEMASYGWDVVRNSWGGERSYLKTNEPRLKAAGWIQLAVARKLFAGAGKDLDSLMKAAGEPGFKPVPLNARAEATVRSKVRNFEANNVVAKITGSDPKLATQAVVISAHYDHLGMREGAEGDTIYNGASDNATGTAMILEMAHAMSHGRSKPKRSVYFAAVTAEEQGLRGSEYLGKNPPVAAANIALGLNFDNIQPWGEPEQIKVTGADRTTFYPLVQQAAKEFNLQIVPDDRPEAGSYYRSDHFSLARVGVPAFSIGAGLKYKGRDAAWGEQKGKEYNQKRYHQPTDEYTPDMDFTANVKIAQFGIALAQRAATQPQLVQWQAGDEFEAARKASQSGKGGDPASK